MKRCGTDFHFENTMFTNGISPLTQANLLKRQQKSFFKKVSTVRTQTRFCWSLINTEGRLCEFRKTAHFSYGWKLNHLWWILRNNHAVRLNLKKLTQISSGKHLESNFLHLLFSLHWQKRFSHGTCQVTFSIPTPSLKKAFREKLPATDKEGYDCR